MEQRLASEVSDRAAAAPKEKFCLAGSNRRCLHGRLPVLRGSGTPWHEASQKYAEENLKRFEDEWSKYLRGSLPVKRDDEITEDDIAGKHLILFGDPSSNSLIGQVLDGLPLKWTREQIQLGGKSYAAGAHVPVMIYPSPLQYGRYVVLNSGHTFTLPTFRGPTRFSIRWRVRDTQVGTY